MSSLLQSVTNTSTATSTRTSPESASAKTPVTPTTPKPKPPLSNNLKQDMLGKVKPREKERQLSPPPPPPPPRPQSAAHPVSPPSLESKINSFLQGNPGFSVVLGDDSPDGVDGTPVRDEAAGTPTQDEIMDTPVSMPDSLASTGGHNLSPTAYRNEPWDAAIVTSSNDDGNGLNDLSPRFGTVKRSSTQSKADKAKRKHDSTPDMKGKQDEKHGPLRIMGNSRAMGERRLSAGSRKMSTGSDDDGGPSGKKADNGKEFPEGDEKGGQYHRIETLVSPQTERAPIQTLGYSNRPLAGERIKTVESIRVIGQGSRRGGGAGSRAGAAMWYEEEEYLETRPPSSHAIPPPPNLGQRGIGDTIPSMPPPPPPPLPHLLVPHLHPPPPLPLPHPLPPQTHFQMPYHTENIQTPPPSHLQHHPTSPYFGVPPPIPHPPPPPPLQRPSPPPTRAVMPSAVMVGGVLVPLDPVPSIPPPMKPEVAERGGMGPRGSKVTPPPLMSSLLGEPAKLPRPGTVKEPFVPRHTPPLHRPGTPGVPPPLLGRVKEPLILPHPSPSPSPTSSSASPPTPNSPAGDSAPGNPPASPPAQPLNKTPHPVPLLNLPTPRPPILSTPISQRPLLRGQSMPQDHLFRGGFRRGKRYGPRFTGGPFQKRPFLPPRY